MRLSFQAVPYMKSGTWTPRTIIAPSVDDLTSQMGVVRSPHDHLDRHPEESTCHAGPDARFRRARQGGRARAPALRRRGHRVRSLRGRARDAGRASQPRVRHARPRGAAEDHRAGEAAPDRPGDRGDRDPGAARARGRRLDGHSHGRGRAAHDGSRGDPPGRGRGARPANGALPVRRYVRRAGAREQAARVAGRDQADHELVGQGPDRSRSPRPSSRSAGSTRRPAAAPAPAA